jgi:hypothetical protein
MAYFTPGSLIHCGTNAAIWRVTAVNPDGSIEVVYVPQGEAKRSERQKEAEGREVEKADREAGRRFGRRLGDADGLGADGLEVQPG